MRTACGRSCANQLENAILNLAINVRDVMPEGGRLTIEAANAQLDGAQLYDAHARAQGGEARPGQHVAISVADTGTGMAPEVIAKAFDPFFTTKPISQGTGLGLSMIPNFASQSGGSVRIHSEVGQGTVLTLYLPRHQGRPDAASDEAGGAGSALPLPAGVSQAVLVVEDEAAIRVLLTAALDELGYVAIEAADGPSALCILQSDARIDLLITDVGLPGLNGRQLADAARVSRPALRVLFMTGHAHSAAAGRCATLDPGKQLLMKPFTLDVLATKIRGMIGNM